MVSSNIQLFLSALGAINFQCLTSLEWWGQISNQSIIWYTHYGIACHYTQIECNVKTCKANQLEDWFNTPW